MSAGRLIAVAVAAALGGAVATGCGDDPDQIDEGVRIAGIDVGEMQSADAERVVKRKLARSSERRLTAVDGKRKIKLPRPDPPPRVDVDAVVRDALRAAPDTNVSVHDHVRGTGDAVDPLVEHVRAEVDVAPRDARIAASSGAVNELTSRTGRTVRGERLASAILFALLRPGSKSNVAVQVDEVEPKVTTEELAREYPRLISIDRGTFTLRLYDHLKLAKEYTVAVGASGYDTPSGEYEVESKQVDPVWSVPSSDWTGDLAGSVIPPGPSNPLKARWIGFAGAAGIHGTDDVGSLGTAASHGCIRMDVPDVIDLYERVEVGTPVYVS